MAKIHTAERVSQTDASDNFVYQRSLLAYHYAAGMVSGDVLEIGTGSGYGVETISPKAKSFTTIDKHEPPVDITPYNNVTFRSMTVPPLTGFAPDSFDYVITFQVIEHIKNDRLMLEEIRRVLKPGGRLIISTPNKKMSITRNPWHVREYTVDEFKRLLGHSLTVEKAEGVFGKQNVNDYYEENKRSTAKVTRFDIFNMQWWLPRWMLQIPYDILNRRNRRKLLTQNSDLTAGIRMSDYYVAPADDACYDLLFTAIKK